MENSSETPSPSSRTRSKKLNLGNSELQSPDSALLGSKTPDKTLHRRTRNRGVALSVAEIRKVAEGLQDRKQRNDTTSSPEVKTDRRQIVLPSPSKPKNADDEPFKLPEKYEILGKFFDSLDSSIRLLRLKGSSQTFTNISPKIECLTDRRFTLSHLAQLKFVLPEAIVIKKILVFDERTSCMKPDLHVTIDPDAVESDAKLLPQGGSVSLRLRNLFRVRLGDFCKSHPEGDEIPEETLPEPFNRPKKDLLLDINESLSVPVMTSVELPKVHPAVACHMSQSFKRQFSQKSKKNGADNIQQNAPVEGTKSYLKAFPAKLASEAVSSERCPKISCSLESSTAHPATPSKTKDGSLKSIDPASTPAKLVSTPSHLMTITPVLPPPKRHYMSPDDNPTSSLNKLVRRPPRSRSLKFDTPDDNSANSLNKLVRCPPHSRSLKCDTPDDNSTSSLNKLVRRPSSRSLKFDTPVKNKEIVNEDGAGDIPIDDDIFDILPENLIESIREKERIAMEERDPAISQAKRRKKIIASLPKLFNMIHLLSNKRSVITKEELVSKIISSHCDIVDKSEVEEQLNLLLELVPEWISEKLASSGDFLFCINKTLNPETVRASLEEAQ